MVGVVQKLHPTGHPFVARIGMRELYFFEFLSITVRFFDFWYNLKEKMLKFLIILMVLAVGAYFVINQIPSLKERVIEAINPAVKEERLLGELKANLDELGQNLDEAGGQKTAADIKSGIKSSKNLLENSKDILGEISKINSKPA